jgi:hypothetical protein
VHPTTGVVTIVSGGTTTIRATQAAAGNYTSAYVQATLLVELSVSSLTWSNITKLVSTSAFPLIGDLEPSSNVSLSYGDIWNFLGTDIDGEAANDQSGYSVSLSADGTIVAIGANYNSTYKGHVRVYKYDPNKTTAVTDQSSSDFGPIGWRRLGQDIDGEAAGDLSGDSVSLSADGTILAIGASENDGNGNYSGHVRVYSYDVTKTTDVTDQSSPDFGPVGWRRLGQDIDSEDTNDRSGFSVSLSANGTIVAIGAWANGSNSGHVRVYSYDVTKTTAVTDQSSPDFGPIGWRRLGQDIDGEAAGDLSGDSVSLSADGTILAIGASENDGNGNYSGHVRVYSYDVTKTTDVTDQSSPDFGPVGWRRLGQDIDSEDTNDRSGFSVSLSANGTIVAIGAWANGSNSGHVRVYSYDVTKTTAVTDQSSLDFGPIGWRRLGQDIDGEAANDISGDSVSLSADGTIVAIGASENSAFTGHVRVYKYDPTKTTTVTDQSSPDFGPIGWRRLGQDIDGEVLYDYSGVSVSLSSDGTILAIGAFRNDGNDGTSYTIGHVRVLKIDSFGNFTYTSDTPAVADVYGNIVLLRSIGESTLTARQSATSNSLSGTVDATLTVSLSPTLALVANYSFDSDGNDASTNNNHLTNHNTVTFDTVNFRQGTGAALFDGSNYFEIANDGRFSPDNFTVACWIKPVNSEGNYQAVASCRNGTVPNVNGWMIYINPDNNLQFWTGAGEGSSGWSGGNDILYTGFGNLNAWVHLAFTFTKSTGSLKFFINGALYSTVSRSYANTTINNLRIGAGANESNALFFLRNGTLLDDFRFYNATLSASQVNDIYSN